MTLLSRLARSLPVVGAEASIEPRQHAPDFTICVRDFGVQPDATRLSFLGGAFARLVLPTFEQIRSHVSTLGGEVVSSIRSLLVLDCETTALGAGGGPVPFMIGLGHYVSPNVLRIQQWVLRSLAAEAAMLSAFAATLGEQSEAACLVTFNGASFDLPLIKARLRRYGLSSRWPQAHLDLVHASRRLFRKMVPDRRLATLERTQLGVIRRGDLPGFEIPGRFWQAQGYVPGAGEDPLEDVLDHNVGDVLSLPALLAHLACLVRRPIDADMDLAAARLLCATGRAEQALSRLETAMHPWLEGLEPRPPSDAPRSMAVLAAALWRRQARFDRAVRLLRWACREYAGDPEVHERLAKDLEHRLTRPEEALAVASGSRSPCARRLARLQHKAEKARKSHGEPPLFEGCGQQDIGKPLGPDVVGRKDQVFRGPWT